MCRQALKPLPSSLVSSSDFPWGRPLHPVRSLPPSPRSLVPSLLPSPRSLVSHFRQFLLKELRGLLSYFLNSVGNLRRSNGAGQDWESPQLIWRLSEAFGGRYGLSEGHTATSYLSWVWNPAGLFSPFLPTSQHFNEMGINTSHVFVIQVIC